jgi:hypothetical protein
MIILRVDLCVKGFPLVAQDLFSPLRNSLIDVIPISSSFISSSDSPKKSVSDISISFPDFYA